MKAVLLQGPRPAWATRRSNLPTRGGLDRQVAKLLGWAYYPWQEYVTNVAGEYDPFTKVPHYRTVGVSVARQNGKTTLVCSRVARQLIAPRQTVAYTAQDRGLARTKWDEHVTLLMDTPFADRVERVDRTNHREMLVMQNGSRYMPVTPSRSKAGRSLSIDLAVVDEARSHPSMDVIAAIAPAMSAKVYAQIWLLSNAGDLKSGMWRHYTDIGRLEVENPTSTMAWFEWAPHTIANLEDLDQYDRQAWAESNPSMGYPGGVLETAIADGALTMDRATFFQEHLNVWANSDAMMGLDAVLWASLRNDDLMPRDELCFALDFTPERDRGALAVAGVEHDADGGDITPIELVDAGHDLERLIGKAAEVANRWGGDIVIGAGSAAASAIPALERMTYDESSLKHRVRVVSMTETARACGDFHDAATHARISHRGDYRMADAVAVATKRKIGDTWVWDRRAGGDISPVMAVTLARWGVVTAPEELVPAVW